MKSPVFRNNSKLATTKKVKKFYFLLTITATLLLTYINYLMYVGNQWRIGTLQTTSGSRNYFLEADLAPTGFVINTSKCQVPDFSPWNKEMIPFIAKAEQEEECKKTSFNWSYMDDNVLVMRTRNMKIDGYSFQNGSCCYKIIQRVEQSENHYDTNADGLISYSSCIGITEVRTEILGEFIMVECSPIFRLIGVVAYRGFHAIAQIGKMNPPSETWKKVRFWKERHSKFKEESIPPNILVIGIDSTSRINFRRNMFKTKDVLESLGAVEMLGYVKVGENTYPNHCPIFMGYSEEEVQKICYFNSSTKFDDCPFIWKRLDEANYITAQIEDAPDFTAFNFMKTGFVRQPVDFYPRPIFLAGHDYGSLLKLKRSEHIDCLAYETNDEVIANYMERTMDFAIKENVPIFSLSWSTTLSHSNPNQIQVVDGTYSDLINRLDKKGHLNNTILIFMGDHGYRFGPWRETLIGYYEDRLPNMWIRLPPEIREKFPQWQRALEINSKHLTSPYLIYWTMNLILDTFTSTKPPKDSINHFTGEKIPRNYQQNFFEPVPETNTCEAIGIPEEYCPCYPLQKVDVDDPTLIQAARTATIKINTDLKASISTPNNKCSLLNVSKVTAGAVVDKTSNSKDKKLRYIVGFVTQPGDFIVEAELDFFLSNRSFSETNLNVQRANKISQTDIRCVKDAKLELFCYCNS